MNIEHCFGFSSTSLPDILLPVLGAEAEVLVEPCPHIVPVQPIGGDPLGDKVFLQRKGEGRLPRPRQTREPDCAAAKAAVRPVHLAAAVARDRVLLKGDVGRLLKVPVAP